MSDKFSQRDGPGSANELDPTSELGPVATPSDEPHTLMRQVISGIGPKAQGVLWPGERSHVVGAFRSSPPINRYIKPNFRYNHSQS